MAASPGLTEPPPPPALHPAVDRDSPGEHWVTINGSHVLIHEPQGRQAAKEQPSVSVTILGRDVAITFDESVSPQDRIRTSKAIVDAAELLNKNADKLTADERKAISEISSVIVTELPNAYLGATGGGSMTLSFNYIHDNSTAWLASVFGHEGQHYLNAGKYSGAERWRDEQSASKTQLGIGNKAGFSSRERIELKNWMDDKNRTKIQKHMERGYTD